MQQSNKSRFDKNLQRVFSLIPLIHANPGIHLEELQKQANYSSKKDLLRDLDRLLLFGGAPFGPSDFISISIESDQVFIDFPQGLERPLDLTASEWLVLNKIVAAEKSFQKSGDLHADALTDIFNKISSIPVQISEANQESTSRRWLQEALEDMLQIEFRYRSLSSRETELRHLDPWAVYEHQGLSYLIGFCHTRQAIRNFSLLRMKDIEILDLEVEHHCPPNVNKLILESAVFNKKPTGLTIRMAFAPVLQRVAELVFGIEKWQDLMDHDLTFVPSDWLIAEFKIASRIWLFEILRGMGPKAVILGPDPIRQAFKQELDHWFVCQAMPS